MDGKVNKITGANMDVDLTSSEHISWKQDCCPWNVAEKSNVHKCAVRNISICPYFCGIEYIDKVLCCYPKESPNVNT